MTLCVTGNATGGIKEQKNQTKKSQPKRDVAEPLRSLDISLLIIISMFSLCTAILL